VFTIYCFVVRFFEAIGAAAFSTASYTYIAKLFPDNIGACLVRNTLFQYLLVIN